jgi:hypothetical protein
MAGDIPRDITARHSVVFVASFQFAFVTDGHHKRFWKQLETARTSLEEGKNASIEVIDKSKQRNITFDQPSVNNRYHISITNQVIRLLSISFSHSLTRSIH